MKWTYNYIIDKKRQSFLAFGYMRQEERKYKLTYNMPAGIKIIIARYIEIYRKESDKPKDIRILISTMDKILDSKLNWKPIPLSKMLTDPMIKKGYYKAVRLVHPDKSIGRGDDIECQVICDYVFDILEQAFYVKFC